MENTKSKYNHLDTKIRNIENKLKPILSTPLNPETTRSDQRVVEKFHHSLRFMKDRLSAEMESTNEPRHVEDIVQRVILLQKAAHAWTEGRPVNSGGEESSCSFVESCVTDDDSGVAGFKVYGNPVFDGGVGDDIEDIGDDSTVGGYEGDVIRVAERDEGEESEAVNKNVEKEVLEIDYQKDENVDQEEEENEEDHDDYNDEEEEEGDRKCCYKVIFWGVITVMAWMTVLIGFPVFPDQHSSVILLAPT
ncbi:hypothetical protein RND81_14G127700 [Saponaria officinalis]|uniref:DUF7610 domain-containing protein n=1 Tax=Saponaria officinalis TaxID=3572 RepID=A0AAW1GP89_SAPOF